MFLIISRNLLGNIWKNRPGLGWKLGFFTTNISNMISSQKIRSDLGIASVTFVSNSKAA